MKPLTTLLSLEGRRAVVTGAASGIGLAVTRRLVGVGAEVVAVDRDEESLIRASTRLPIESVTLDLLEREGIRTFWEDLDPTPDILINNAGLSILRRPLPRLTKASSGRLWA